MLEIWGRKTSSNVQALMWAVGELGLDHIRHDIGHRFGGTDTPEFVAMNPNRTVPVLRDGDGPALWETGAILRYLASRYGADSFWPADLLARTEVDRWAEWAKINITLRFTGPIFWRVVRTPPARRDATAITRALTAFEDRLRIAEDHLKTDAYLAGPAFTLADIQFGHVLYRYYDIDIPRADLPALRAYYRRLTDRPAFRDHVMTPYDELRAT